MKIAPLAAESMGTRSMATYVETQDCRLLLDPGASLGPLRYGLAPHPLELWCLEKHRERIGLFAQSAEVIVITHYHFDHFIPDALDLYRGKVLLLKNPNQKINVSQRNRAFSFLKAVKGLPKEVNYVDGRTFRFGETEVVFSPPVSHGLPGRMGFVIQVALREGEAVFLFSSDVQGPCHDDAVDFILKQNPSSIYLDGPITYLRGDAASKEVLDKALERMAGVVEKTNVIRLIVDHHLLRDLRWKEKITPLFDLGRRKGILIQTAAEYRGEENNLLEARRRQLYKEDPPGKGKGRFA